MKLILKLIFKIIAIPFVAALTILAAFTTFLFCVASSVLTVVSVILALLSIAMFATGCMLHNCIWVMVFAFLLSPLGIQAIAEWLVDLLHSLNYSLKCFITS
jgi:hypothetical protein